MAVKEKAENVSDEIEWNVDTEVQLFYAMHGHKPVGVNKYFQMVCILEKFRHAMSNKDSITSKVIWDHLETMYDLQALDDTENLPFPNDEKEFTLPPAEFAHLMEEKKKRLESVNDVVIKKEVINRNETVEKKEAVKEIKDVRTFIKKENKDILKDVRKEVKEIKEPKKIVSKDAKEVRRESKDSKEIKREIKKEIKDIPREVRREFVQSPEPKLARPRASIKEKRESKKDEDADEVSLASLTVKKEKLKEVSENRVEDSPKRSGKRSTRGSWKPDDTASNKSSSPVPTPPPAKRRRT